MISWVAAGLVAETALYAAIAQEGRRSFDGFGHIAWALVPTLVLAAGIFLSKARADFEWLADYLHRMLEEKIASYADSLEKLDDKLATDRKLTEWPQIPEACYALELVCTFLAGLFLLILIWWPQAGMKVGAPTDMDKSVSGLEVELSADAHSAVEDVGPRYIDAILPEFARALEQRIQDKTKAPCQVPVGN